MAPDVVLDYLRLNAPDRLMTPLEFRERPPDWIAVYVAGYDYGPSLVS